MRRDDVASEESQTFAAVLKRYRIASGLTHEQLAERAGLSVRGISDLERGARARPRAYTLHQLAEALGLSADDRAIFEATARAEVALPAGEDVSPIDAVFGPLPEGELVAREGEVAHLRAALAAAQGGAGGVVLLGGEQGIGKTRLLTEAVVDARARGCVVLGARCSPAERDMALAPFLAALGGLAAASPTGVRTEVQRSWKRLARLAERSPSNGGGGPSAIEQGELFRVITDLLLLVARSWPVVVVLNDLQWADEQSLLLLVHLARAVRSAPILLLGAFHDVRLTEEHPALAQTLGTLSRERLVDRLTVRRLSLEETTRLVGTLMGEQPVAEELAHFVYRRTKGIPRLIEQLVRSLGGRLELEGEIGAGAMGRVFRAYDRERAEEVAAKLVLSRSEIELDALLRFQQEGAVLARLQHPHIVDIYDTFAEEHASCIIMELLQGRSLGEVLRDGPLPLRRAKALAALAAQVAQALAYAHSQQIVHRDIKPDNVMVLEGDHVKVTDFGIARILQPDTSLQTIATTGMRIGTPLYMAPEQIGGKKVDGRTDIYALGAMLYHMVTGRPPFEGDDALAVAVKHLQEEPVPPSGLDPAIPADWDAVILKAMAKDPARRYGSAREMGEAITALGEGAAPQPANSGRRWRIAGAAGAVGLAAAVGGGLWAHGTQDPPRPGPAARIDAYLAQHHFSGYALFERHGQVLLNKGYGAADRKVGRPMTIRTRLPVAGVNRFMTGIAILRLQDQHRLSVHDRLCRYITGCPAAWKHITIHQLLLDTSGLGTFDTLLEKGGVPDTIAHCKALPVEAPDTIRSGPESRCDNVLLNTIIANVTGKPWTAAMNDLLFRPAHMTDSGQLTSVRLSRLQARGYSAGSRVQFGNLNNYYIPYSSARDLYRLDRALLSGHLLSRHALHALFTPYVSGDAVVARYSAPAPSSLSVCYECYLRPATPRTVAVADHAGTFAGFGANDALSPDDGTIAIMVDNDESGLDPRDVLFGPASHLLWDKGTLSARAPAPLTKHIAAYLKRARFNGYVYLERHGQVILNRGFGMADAEDKLPNSTQIKWPAFAATRFFVALAIMKLQDGGKVSVQNRICDYVGPCPPAWRRITIKELLTNTSGIGYFNPFRPGVTRQGTMAACKAMPVPKSPLVASNTWSDCNTFVLGAIVQKLTGKTWESAMENLVYRPAGMTDTGLMNNGFKPPRIGQFYRTGISSPALNYNGYYLPYTTVDDMIRLSHAFLAGKLISQRSMHAMLAPEMPTYPSDPGSPRRGYELDMDLDSATTYKVVCAICTPGGGEDDTGVRSGFFLGLTLSPASGGIQIEVVNDTGYYSVNDDNAFTDFIKEPLYGK